MNTTRTRLSASRIKTFYSCSYLYYAKYVLKAPDPSNEGASIGSVVHLLCEILFNKDKYFQLVEEIKSSGIFPEGVKRLSAIKLKKTGFYSDAAFEKTLRFLLTALKVDFWIDGATVIKKPEEEFLIDNEKFQLYGLIDKYGLFQDPDGSWRAEIRDMKTSKERFTENEMDFSIQAMAYLLAVKKAHPEVDLLKSTVKFIMLQFPDDPIQEFKLQNEFQILGFATYLENTQLSLDSFRYVNRLDNPASKQKYPKSEDGFKGPLMCGRAKYPGELKKDGTKMWHCVYKFGFDYWVAIDANKKILFSSFDEIKPTAKFSVEKKKYKGCEACYQRR